MKRFAIVATVLLTAAAVHAQQAGTPPPPPLQVDPALTGAAQPAKFRPEELEAIVAPIALYPDALLAQVLMASTYPLEIVEAARWSKANPSVTGDAVAG